MFYFQHLLWIASIIYSWAPTVDVCKHLIFNILSISVFYVYCTSLLSFFQIYLSTFLLLYFVVANLGVEFSGSTSTLIKYLKLLRFPSHSRFKHPNLFSTGFLPQYHLQSTIDFSSKQHACVCVCVCVCVYVFSCNIISTCTLDLSSHIQFCTVVKCYFKLTLDLRFNSQTQFHICCRFKTSTMHNLLYPNISLFSTTTLSSLRLFSSSSLHRWLFTANQKKSKTHQSTIRLLQSYPWCSGSQERFR